MFVACTAACAHALADSNTSLHLKPAVEGERSQPFDDAVALKISQAAIGRDLSGYTLRDRDGRTVKLADYRGKPLVISLIYTSCYHVCPMTTRNLARTVNAARSAVGADAFAVATIGFDVHNDTPERMRGFARQQGVGNAKNWHFLSADAGTIAKLTTNVGFLYKKSSKGFDHLIQATVVDANGRIYRQIYGMNPDPGLLTGTMEELILGRVPSLLNVSALVNKVRLYCTKYDPATGTYRFNYSMVFATGIGVAFFVFTGVVVARILRKSFQPRHS